MPPDLLESLNGKRCHPRTAYAIPSGRGIHDCNMLLCGLYGQDRDREGPMRAAAIVANLIQMMIILALFLIHGIALGGWTIFALFLLLLVAFVNLLVLLFHSALSATDQSAYRNEKGGLVKRQDLRVRYLGDAQPELAVDDRCFSVLDLSENGVRIKIDRHEPLKRRFRGRLTLLSRKILTLRVTRVRRQGDEAALLIAESIDWDLLSTEKQLSARPLGQRPG